ncbi:hypothetical protein BD779DRAFT_1669977 [Infundibulicybe gibba]|nr:hypothetical protein BD779DRAFT_1669977 [Infundibulicybe gibba]
MSTSPVNDFLLSSKEAFLRNPADGKTTIVMGNEAGDLDSLASAIAYAWILSNAATPTPAVALIQTPPADLALRPENTHALSLAGVSDPPSALLTPSTLPALHPTTPIALVDHNALGPAFPRPGNVIAILDHHADEGQHPNASPRIEIAALLLSAILLDTGGLKPGGRALDVDRAAASALAAHAGLLSDALTGEIHETPALRELTGALEQHKANVAHLTPSQLLRRDYKEYDFVHGGATVRVGLASVPLGLSKWAGEGALRAAAETHMQTRSVGVLGVLTSFSKEKKDKGKKDKKDKKDKGKKDKEHDEETGEKPEKKDKKDKKEKKDKAHKEGGEEGEKEHAEDGEGKKKEKAHKEDGEGKKDEVHKEGGEEVKKETAEDGEGKEKKDKAHKEGAEEHEGGKKEKKDKKDKGHKDVGEEGEEGKKEKKEKKDKAHKKDKDVEEDDADAGGEKKEKKDKKDKAHKKDKEHKGEEDTGKKDKKDKDKKPKHRREMAWLVAPSSSPPSAALAERLWAGLEASTELQVASHAKFTFADEGAKAEEKKEGEAGMHTRVYEQGNARANRKVVAPLVRAIIHEGPSAGTGAGAGVGEAGAAASVTAGGVGAAATGAVTGAGAADGGAAAAAAAADGGAAAE